jgi:hypothetical protein
VKGSIASARIVIKAPKAARWLQYISVWLVACH